MRDAGFGVYERLSRVKRKKTFTRSGSEGERLSTLSDTVDLASC
jgi:hypothetical protein